MGKKMQEIRERPDEELKIMLLDLDKEIFRVRNELSYSKKAEKPHLLKENRRKKARILTEMTERAAPCIVGVVPKKERG